MVLTIGGISEYKYLNFENIYNFWVGDMKRAILLQTLATKSKNNRLNEFIDKALNEYNRLLSERESCKRFM
jgi:hypothetical protein